MEYKTVWTNYLYGDEEAKALVEKYLNEGCAVHVDSTCIGHTRAAMVIAQGAEYMEQLGAHRIEPEQKQSWMAPWYKL
jgi:hypothetical protein